MPTPRKGEKKPAFISRCIPIVINDGTAKDQKQAAAICYSLWAKSKGKKKASDPWGKITNQKENPRREVCLGISLKSRYSERGGMRVVLLVLHPCSTSEAKKMQRFQVCSTCST